MDQLLVTADELGDAIYQLGLLFVQAFLVSGLVLTSTAPTFFSDRFKPAHVPVVYRTRLLRHKVIMAKIEES